MNMKHIVAALALSLWVATSNTQAAEVSVDLGAHIQQVIAEIHVGNTDWNEMVGRIDRLVAHIDEQVLDGTGDYEELSVSRRRLVNARTKIAQQHLTAAQLGGEVATGPVPAAACEVCGIVHSAPVACPAPLSYGDPAVDGGFNNFDQTGVSGGYSTGGSVSGGGGGGGGGGGVGGLGALAGLAAVIATIGNDNNNSPGFPASPSTP